MRILLGHPQYDGQTGVFIKNGFETLGHEIVGVHDSFLEPANKFLEMAKELKPDLIFTAKVNNYNHIIDQLSKISLLSFWSYDVRDDISLWLQDTGPLYSAAHFFFTIGKSDLAKYKQVGLKNCYWLPEGIDPTIHYKPKDLTFKDHLNYDCDAAFAGSVGTVHDGSCRREMHNLLLGEDFNYQHFENVFNEEHNKLVNCTKINIGNSGWPYVEGSMSARDYRVMGAGGFLLTNKVNDIEDWFEIGKMCDIYLSPEDCIKKIKYYLEHEDERKEMAEYAMKIVHEKHKFSDRLSQVIHVAENYHG